MHSATKSSDPRMTRYQLHSRRSEGLYTSLVQRVRPGTGYLTHACSCSTCVKPKRGNTDQSGAAGRERRA
eukprot:1520651-Prymnesium_polylepis.1